MPVSLALDFDQSQISEGVEATDDDQRIRNIATVSRNTGSSFTYEQVDGPMGTGPDGPGIYPDSRTLNVETDDDLANQAGYLVGQGTVDEDRWPVVGLDFARNPEIISNWTALGYGQRATIDNPLSQADPDQVDVIIEGTSEFFNSKLWEATLSTSPFLPYHIFVLSDGTGDTHPFLGRLTATSCVLAESIDSTQTSFTVTTSTTLLTTDSDDYTPAVEIEVGGERMSVTAVSGGSNPQTLTVVRSINGVVKAHSTGDSVELVSPGVFGF